jgi:hypothetical protein
MEYFLFRKLGARAHTHTHSVLPELMSHRVVKRYSPVFQSGLRVYNKELSDVYSSSNIFRVIKTGSMRWTGHVSHVGKRRGVYRVLVGKPE